MTSRRFENWPDPLSRQSEASDPRWIDPPPVLGPRRRHQALAGNCEIGPDYPKDLPPFRELAGRIRRPQRSLQSERPGRCFRAMPVPLSGGRVIARGNAITRKHWIDLGHSASRKTESALGCRRRFAPISHAARLIGYRFQSFVFLRFHALRPVTPTHPLASGRPKSLALRSPSDGSSTRFGRCALSSGRSPSVVSGCGSRRRTLHSVCLKGFERKPPDSRIARHCGPLTGRTVH